MPFYEDAARVDAAVRLYAAGHAGRDALVDLWQGVTAPDIWWRFALHDTRQRFRRSLLGPLWITLSMGIMIAAMGVVFSSLFGQAMDQTLPHIAVGIICWGLLTNCIIEGASAFIGAESFIRNVPVPLSVHYFRVLARNVIVFGFNMLIYFGLLAWFRFPLGWGVLAALPGFVLLLANSAWMGLLTAVISTRYRDIPQLVASILQVVFYLTPVFWSPDALPDRPAFVALNPLYQLLELVRAPLLGGTVDMGGWAAGLALCLIGTGLTLLAYRRAHGRLAYWV